MKFQDLLVRARKCETRIDFRGRLELRQWEAWEFALHHAEQCGLVHLRSGHRIARLVAEVLRECRQVNQNEADAIDGKVDLDLAGSFYGSGRDQIKRILQKFSELRIGKRLGADRAAPRVELA